MNIALVALGGEVVALIVAIVAVVRSFRKPGYYDGMVYGMTPQTHRRYGVVAAGLGLVCGILKSALPVLVLPAVVAIVILAILYFASFVRGAEADE